LERFAALVAACSLDAIVTGSTVTTNEERPLYSFGEWHAPAGALVGILTIGLAVWLSRTEQRGWLRRLGWITLTAVVAECLLGLPPAPQPAALRVAHSLLAQLLFSALAAVAVFTSAAWQRACEPVVDASALGTLAKITPALVLAQAVLGVAHRHGVIEVLPHFLGALVVVIFILIPTMTVIYRPQHEALRPAAVTLLIVACVQFFVGFALFTMKSLDVDPAAVIVTTMIHAGVAALALAASVVLAAVVWRGVRAPESTRSGA
jgi:cytochrome c oxidase assembly protein subunit 15